MKHAFLMSSAALLLSSFQQAHAETVCHKLDFIIYFETGSAELTNAAQRVVEWGLKSDQQNECKIERIEISGHTDTAEDKDSNYTANLSLHRANAVAAAIIANGATAQKLDLSGFGATRPARSTEAGVKEPLNRRVEVVAHSSAE